MANLTAPLLDGTMGISNTAVTVSPASLVPLTVPFTGNVLAAPTADMLADLNEAGIQAVPIIG
jgi:hypothetical protein